MHVVAKSNYGCFYEYEEAADLWHACEMAGPLFIVKTVDNHRISIFIKSLIELKIKPRFFSWIDWSENWNERNRKNYLLKKWAFVVWTLDQRLLRYVEFLCSTYPNNTLNKLIVFWVKCKK